MRHLIKLFALAFLFAWAASSQAQTFPPGLKISAMPTHNSAEVDSAYAPILVNGQNRKAFVYLLSKKRIDSLVGAVQVITGTPSIPTSRLLTINGVTYDLTADRTWTISTMTNPTTTTGDMIYRDGFGNLVRLPIGATNQMLKSNGAGSVPVWSSDFFWGGKWGVISTISSASTSLSTGQPIIRYVGVGGTLTLPSSANTNGIFLKNAGTGTVTVQRLGVDQISTGSHSALVTSFTLPVGQSVYMYPYPTGGAVAPNNIWEVLFYNTSSGGGTTNASDLTSGTLADARLSTNIPRLNGANTWTGSNIFNSSTSIGDISATELGYLNNVTSNIQDQINNITGGETVTRLSSNQVNDNAVANTLEDVTGLSFPVVSGNTYEFEFTVFYTADASTTGSRWTLDGASASQIFYESRYNFDATSFSWATRNAYNQPSGTSSGSSTTANMAFVKGTIVASATGSVQLRFASEVAGSAITALANVSYVKHKKIN
jgi:hypothetical protein